MPSVSRLVGRLFGVTARRQIGPPDHRRRYDDAAPGRPVVVVGAGIAGMSAAIVLAERGVPVTVCEAAGQPGGRLDAVRHTLPDATTQWVDHGFHGFFRQYYNWRAILRRIGGAERLLYPLDSYPVVSHRWPTEEFDGLPPTPPLSIVGLVARSPSLRLRELVRADHHVARSLLGFDRQHTYQRLDDISAETLMAGLRLPERARAMLFNVFAHSFFNDAAGMSAADLVAMFHFYFLANPEGLGMDAPRLDYQTAIWTPLQAYLERHGGEVRTGTAVERLERRPDGQWRARVAGGPSLTAAQVVLAVDAAAAGPVLAGSPEVTAGDARLAATARRPLAGPPYAVARFWLAGDVAASHAPFTSIGDPDLLDSVTLYHRVEAGARDWHDRTGGAVLELHAYACPDHVDADELGEAMRAELAELWPEVRSLSVIDRRCHVGHDAAGFPVGAHHTRPHVGTALPGLVMAGDWIDLPVPSALMERAATTGIMAANRILTTQGRPVEPIWSVPARGILADQWIRQRHPRHPAPLG